MKKIKTIRIHRGVFLTMGIVLCVFGTRSFLKGYYLCALSHILWLVVLVLSYKLQRFMLKMEEKREQITEEIKSMIYNDAFLDGTKYAYVEMVEYMRSLWNTPNDEWVKQAWKFAFEKVYHKGEEEKNAKG